MSATRPGSRAHGQRPRRPTQVRCPVQDRAHPVTPGPAFTRQCWCKCTVTGRKLTGVGRPGSLGPGGRPAEQPRALLASGHRAPGRPRGRRLDSLLQGAGRGDPGQAAWREALLPTPCEHSERERGQGSGAVRWTAVNDKSRQVGALLRSRVRSSCALRGTEEAAARQKAASQTPRAPRSPRRVPGPGPSLAPSAWGPADKHAASAPCSQRRRPWALSWTAEPPAASQHPAPAPHTAPSHAPPWSPTPPPPTPPPGPGASCFPPSTRNRLSRYRLGVHVPSWHLFGSFGWRSFRLVFVRYRGQRLCADYSPTLPPSSFWEFAQVLLQSLLLFRPPNCICFLRVPLTPSRASYRVSSGSIGPPLAPIRSPTGCGGREVDR